MSRQTRRKALLAVAAGVFLLSIRLGFSPESAFAQNAISTGTRAGFRMYYPNSNDWWLDPSKGNFDIRVNGRPAFVTLDASGNLGIGTAGPGELLHINKASDGQGMKIQNGTYGGGYITIKGEDLDPGGLVSSYKHTVRFNMATSNQNAGNGADRTVMALFREGWSNFDTVYFPYANVGIGTTNPGGMLEIDGAANGLLNLINIRNTSNGASAINRIQIGNDASPGSGQILLYGSQYPALSNVLSILNANNNALTFGTNNTERVRIDSSGSVGIGTTGPWSLLSLNDVSNTQATQLSVGFSGTETHSLGRNSSTGRFEFKELTNNNGFNFVNGAPNANGTIFAVNSSQLAVNGDSGNVGIGTTSPGYKLDVQGGQVNASGGLCIAADCRASWSAVAGSAAQLASTQTFTGQNTFAAQVAVSSSFFVTGGNVGIGTTNPTSTLNVNASGSSGGAEFWGNGNYALRWGNTSDLGSLTFSASDPDVQAISGNLRLFSNSANVLIQPSGGNVGIGTTSPAQRLHIYGTAGNLLSSIQNTNAAGYSALQLFSDSDQSYLLYGGSAYTGYAGAKSLDIIGGGGPIAFFNTAAEAMRITSSGSVGIGTTGPASKLEINGGSVGANALMLRNSGLYTSLIGKASASADTNAADVTSVLSLGTLGGNSLVTQGNVGVGTASPTAKLSVAGDINATGNISAPMINGGTPLMNPMSGTLNINATPALATNQPGIQVSTNFFVMGGGNVGVGTASSNARLTVENDGTSVAVSSFSNMNNNVFPGYPVMTIQHGRTVNPGLVTAIDVLKGDGSSVARVYGDGSGYLLGGLGLGTTAPAAKLQVNDSGSTTERIRVTGNSGDTLAIKFVPGVDNVFYLASEQAGFNIGYGNTITANRYLTVLPSGNVGIGTASPGAALDILMANTGNGQSNQGALIFRLADGLGRSPIAAYGNIDGTAPADATASAITVSEVAGTGRSITTAGAIYAGNAGGTRPSIMTTGSVGIGTANLGDGVLTVHTSANANIQHRFSGDGSAELRAVNDGFNAWEPLGIDGAPLVLNHLSGGNVGIGTTSPTQALEVWGVVKSSNAYGAPGEAAYTYPSVSGLAYIGADSGAAADGASLSLAGNSNNYNNLPGGVRFNTASANPALVITRLGNVGIGTASPGDALDAAGAIRARSNSQNFNNSASALMDFYANGSRIVATNTGTNSSSMTFITDNAGTYVTAMTISNGGSVGINTPSPSERLTVYGVNNSAPGVLSLETDREDLANVESGRISGKNAGVEVNRISLYRGGGSFTGMLGFWTKGDNLSALSEKMRIDGAGYVGIGTTSPGQALDVAGSVKFSQALMPNNSAGTSGQILVSQGAGSAPQWQNASTAPPVPTRQVLKLGANATYTTPSGARQLRIRMAGGGGGGGSSGTGFGSGSNGGATIFGGVVASSGIGGSYYGSGTLAGQGGSGGTDGALSGVFRVAGGNGCVTATAVCSAGGNSAFGGGAVSAVWFLNVPGNAAAANSGGGGSGATDSSAQTSQGGGGGEYVEFIINSPSATYSYTVGAGGSGSTAGTPAGGNGGSGVIIVDEYY